MRKNILIFLMLVSNYCNAQYFIPLFNETVDTMHNCEYMIADTANNYLMLFTADSASPYNEFLFGYRDNQLYPTNLPVYEYAHQGCSTDSGLIAIFSNQGLFTVDSLEYQPCFYGFCNVSNISAMVSKNDTIYYNANLFGHDFIFGNTPSGTSFQIGDATGGSGISDLEFYNGYLYACGSFNEMDGDASLKYICYWDGNTWHALNNLNQLNTINFGIAEFLIYENQLYMTGGFDLINGIQTIQVASYNETNWLAHPFQGTSAIQTWIVYHNKIWMYGSLFDTLGNHSSFGSYDGMNFQLFQNWPLGIISSMEIFNDTLFLGGANIINGGLFSPQTIVKFVDSSFSSFAPITIKWWYGSGDTAYKYYEVARDTFIMHTANYYGYNCRKITGEQHEHDSTVTPLQPLYVFGDTNRVMYYNNSRGRFVPLYNFNVSTGDTLTYYTPQPQTANDTTFRVVVDSITQLNVQGTNCKRIWSTPLDNWSFGNDGYVQLVGGLGSILPQLINYYNTEGPLRCYEDTSVFYHYLVDVSCEQLDTATGISEQLSVNSFQLSVYPNPANETVTITVENIKEVVVSNLLGVQMMRLLRNYPRNDMTIDVSSLPAGVYFISVHTNDGWRVGKLVKE